MDCFCLISFGRRDVDEGAVDDDTAIIEALLDEFSASACDCLTSAPKLGTLDRDRTICFGGGFKMLPKLLLLMPTAESGSGMSSKSSSRRSSIGRSFASS